MQRLEPSLTRICELCSYFRAIRGEIASFHLYNWTVIESEIVTMNALILAAGYATRLYPLTLNKAKPLLEVAGKPMIEWVLDNLAPIPGIDKVYVVTNNKFAADFQAWADDYVKRQPKLHFKIVNDGSTSDSDKLGAIGDINYVIKTEGIGNNDLIVVAGDNLFNQPLEGFAQTAKGTAACLAVYDVG